MAQRVELTAEPLDPAVALRELAGPADGAVSLFLGVVRDHHDGRRVLRLEYHAYRPMALERMRRIAAEVTARFEARSMVLLHRVGTLEIGEVSVIVAVATPHRAEAFAGCRHAIERIKEEVPIWKKEHFEDGEAWVKGCRPDATEPGSGR
jgi:molybdopterin synthase catalytic subunit